MPMGPFRFHHNGRREYFAAAPKKGEVAYLHAWDTQQWIPDIEASMGPDATPYGSVMRPAPVPVETIIADLLRNTTQNFIGAVASLSPGIAQIAGETVTDAELDRLNKMETVFCNALITEANDIWEKRYDSNEKRRIGSLHRGALEWLGSQGRGAPWYLELETGGFKKGAASGKRIPIEALMDDGTDLIKLYLEYDLDPLEYGDTHIAEMLTRPGFKRRAKVLADRAAHNEERPQ
jgi:lambda repressor-like predicted transcriptional regulator